MASEGPNKGAVVYKVGVTAELNVTEATCARGDTSWEWRSRDYKWRLTALWVNGERSHGWVVLRVIVGRFNVHFTPCWRSREAVVLLAKCRSGAGQSAGQGRVKVQVRGGPSKCRSEAGQSAGQWRVKVYRSEEAQSACQGRIKVQAWGGCRPWAGQSVVKGWVKV